MCRYSADSVRLHPSHAYLRLGVSSARRRLNQLLYRRASNDGTPRITVASTAEGERTDGLAAVGAAGPEARDGGSGEHLVRGTTIGLGLGLG